MRGAGEQAGCTWGQNVLPDSEPGSSFLVSAVLWPSL